MLTVHGRLDMASGPNVVSLRPEGTSVYIDIPTWRCAWKLVPLAWSQRALLRRANDRLAAEGIAIVARFREREIYRPSRSKRQPKEKNMADNRNDTRTWPELAVGLYEQLTGRGAEINYQFDNLEVAVPSRTGNGAEHANWKLNGAIRIRTEDNPKA